MKEIIMTADNRVHWHLTPSGWRQCNIGDGTSFPEDRVLTLEIDSGQNSSYTRVLWTNGNGNEINSLLGKFNFSTL